MPDLAYILSASHSGSTLLAMLLGSHRDAVSVGELAPGSFGDFSQYRCSCRALLLECPFWRRVATEMRARGTDFRLEEFGTSHHAIPGRWVRRLMRPLHRGPVLESLRDAAVSLCPAWRREFPRRQVANRCLIEVIAGLTNRRVVVDSSKRAVRLKYLLRIPQLRVSVIRLIRDGRAVALTYMDPHRFADAGRPELRGGGSGANRNGECLTMEQAAREWRRSNEEAEHLLRTLPPSQWTAVRYEDLCADPSVTLHRLFVFLGLDPARSAPDFRSVEHHVLGNGMRLDESSHIRLDDRWTSHLTPDDVRRFDHVAGDLRKRYAYA